MKWYAYAEDSATYTLILDHDTTASVQWISKEDYTAAGGTEADYGTYGKNDKGPVTANAQLAADTTMWVTELNPRLITAQEVANITCNTSWTTGSGWYFFDSNNQTQTANSQGDSKYAWLFDYTRNCARSGCNIEGDSNNGYLTSTNNASLIDRIWTVNSSGGVTNSYINSRDYGIRPVITVPKNKIS